MLLPLSERSAARIFFLGRMTYYVNRPSYHNLDCVSLSAVILLAYLGQRGMTFVKERKWKHWEEMDLAGVVNGTLGLACAAAVLAMSTGTVLQFSQNSKIKENYHNVGELEAFVQEIAEVVPENTHGFGLNVAEIYSLLHWNTQCFTMDFSDMAVIPESLQELQEQLTEADTSVRQFILLAVYIPEQEPQVGHTLFSNSSTSSSVIVPAA